MDIVFLNLEQAFAIHRRQIEEYGGEPNLRDLAVLQSALAVPQSGMSGEYFHEFPAEMAAAYLFHIVMNHPFVDGNKRAGLATALMFLKLNSVPVAPDLAEVERMTLAVASGQMSKAEVAAVFRRLIAST